MLTAGRVLHHLRRLLPDPNNLILLAGYQAPGTRGRRLLEGEETVKVHGRHVENRARVLAIQGLSGHADREELAAWIGSAPQPPRLAFVVHGEPESAESFARLLARRFGVRTRIPRLDQSFDLLEVGL
jgi:metallo-beta-lactamase family protein